MAVTKSQRSAGIKSNSKFVGKWKALGAIIITVQA